MAGSTFQMDKGAIVESTYGAVTKFRFVKMGTTSVQHIAPNILSSTLTVGVVQDDVDAAKVATGKATVNVRMGGISKVVAGAAVTAGTEVMSDTVGRAITAATATNRVQGIAMTGAAAAGDIIDVWLSGAAQRVL